MNVLEYSNCLGPSRTEYAKHEIGCVNALLNVWLISSARMCMGLLMQTVILFIYFFVLFCYIGYQSQMYACVSSVDDLVYLKLTFW